MIFRLTTSEGRFLNLEPNSEEIRGIGSASAPSNSPPENQTQKFLEIPSNWNENRKVEMLYGGDFYISVFSFTTNTVWKRSLSLIQRVKNFLSLHSVLTTGKKAKQAEKSTTMFRSAKEVTDCFLPDRRDRQADTEATTDQSRKRHRSRCRSTKSSCAWGIPGGPLRTTGRRKSSTGTQS